LHVVEYDATFITPWAALYRKSAQSLPAVVRAYERRWWQLQHENSELRSLARDVRRELAKRDSDLASQSLAMQQTSDQLALRDRQILNLQTEMRKQNVEMNAEIARWEHERQNGHQHVLRLEQGRLLRAMRWLHAIRRRAARKD